MEQKITREKVINGLKFIIDNQNLEYEQVRKGLLDLGCDFTFEDQKREFPNEEEGSLFEGVKEGKLVVGANIIINVVANEFGFEFVKERFLNEKSEYSLYNLVNKLMENKELQENDNSGLKI